MKKNRIPAMLLSVALTMAVAAGGAGITTYAAGQDTDDGGSAASSDAAETVTDSDAAAAKDETVYVMTAADGTVQKILVSDWIKNALPDEAQKAVESLSDAQQVKDDCWTGTLQKELPVSMSVRYTLDGEDIAPDELAGRSGRVTVRFEYENDQYAVKTVNGVSQKVYVPFAALTGVVLDTAHFSNVTVSNGRIFNDGDRIIVMGAAFPSLQEDLGISPERLELPDCVEITADVTDFAMETTLTMVSNSLFNEMDADSLTGGDLKSLSASLDKLTDAVDQLTDGSAALYDGLGSLLAGCGQLSDGTAQLAGGLGQLSANSETLNAGAQQVFTALLAAADAQLAQAGVTVPALTIENYGTVLDSVLAQQDAAGTAQASAGAAQLRALKQQLDQYNAFYTGLNSYTAGVDQAAAGAQQLQSGASDLLNGARQLQSGTAQLAGGLKRFRSEGVEKLADVLGDDLDGLSARLNATVEVSRDYRSFSGLTDGMDGTVRFVYRTEAVEKAE